MHVYSTLYVCIVLVLLFEIYFLLFQDIQTAVEDNAASGIKFIELFTSDLMHVYELHQCCQLVTLPTRELTV